MGNHQKRFTRPAKMIFFQLSLFTDFTMTRLKFLLYATHMRVYDRCENSS